MEQLVFVLSPQKPQNLASSVYAFWTKTQMRIAFVHQKKSVDHKYKLSIYWNIQEI